MLAVEDGCTSCRRLARKRREAELVAFSATRPDDTFESPADLQAIREAERTMGDFKLKSDPEYIPPEASHPHQSSPAPVCEQAAVITSSLIKHLAYLMVGSGKPQVVRKAPRREAGFASSKQDHFCCQGYKIFARVTAADKFASMCRTNAAP